MKRRILDLLALMFVGDGVVSLIEPKRHCLLWEVGPPQCRKFIGVFAERPTLTRSLGLLEMLAGIWLASQQEGGILARAARR
jgi:hypothetical protein